MPYAAAYYDGRVARRHDVAVAVGARGLRVRLPDGREVLWGFEALTLAADGFVGDPLRFERRGPEGAVETLVIGDPAVLRAIARANPGAAKALTASSLESVTW